MRTRIGTLGLLLLIILVTLWQSRVAHAKGGAGTVQGAATSAKQAKPRKDTIDTSKFKAEYANAILYDDALTLVRNRDFRDMHQTVSCPNCKDLLCSDFRSPHPGAKIIGADFIRMRSDGHWYRCQVQASCGRPEFSDPSNAQLGCKDVDTCRICRAVDATFPDEDDIVVHSIAP
jgi:hypothetical protein